MNRSLFILNVFLLFFSFSRSIQLVPVTRPTNLDEYGYSACQYVYTVILIDTVNTISIVSPTTSQFISNLDGNQMFSITFNQVFGDRGILSLTAVANQVETTFTLDNFECLEIPPITMSLNQQMYYSLNYNTLLWIAKIETATPMTKYLPGKDCRMKRVSGPVNFYSLYYSENICVLPMTLVGVDLNTPTIVNFNVSISQNVNIVLTTPFTQDPFVGSIDAIASTGTTDFKFIVDYKDNVNMNPFFIDSYLMTSDQGNAVNGTIYYSKNYKGGKFYGANQDCPISVFENNNQEVKATLQGIILPNSALLFSNDISSVAAVASDPNAAFLKIIYKLQSNFYDYRNTITVSLKQSISRTYVSFPFGYSSGNIQSGYTMSFSYITSSHFANGEFLKGVSESTYVSIDNPLLVPNTVQDPLIESTNILAFDKNRILYSLVMTDTIELVHNIRSSKDLSGFVIAGSESIVGKDGGNIVFFEFFHDPIYKNIYAYSHVGLYQFSILFSVFGSFNLTKIPNIVFLENDIDTTNKTTINTMVLYYDDPGFNLRLARYTSVNRDLMFFHSEYDTSLQAYIIPFIIPPNRKTGYYNYILDIGNPGISYPSELFDVLFEPLRVRSDNYDDIPPLITAMSVLPSSIVIVSSVDDFTELAFVVTISDTYNGLLNGSFWITSELDPYGYNITIDPSMADSGDQYLGVYSLKFNVSKLCKTQTYYIQYVKLLDNAFVQSSSYFPYMDPFMVDWSSITITIQCSDPDDSTPPSISGFSILNGTIDTSLENRVVVVDFSTDDTDLDYSRLPIVYAQEMGFSKTIAGVTTIVDQSTGKLRAHINLPYQFGIIGGVYFSVYGFIDHQMNFNGYSNADLNDLYPSSSSIQTFTTYAPYITSTRGLFKPSSGSVSIYGYNFGKSVTTTITEYTLTVNDDNFQPITSYESLFNSFIVFNRTSTNEPFKVRITKQGTASNSFIVNPIYLDVPPVSSSTSQSSNDSSSSEVGSSSQDGSGNNSGSSNVTPQPLVCPGKLEQCGGTSKGQCINGECVCKSPYITLDCSSQIIIIPEPPIDPVKPNRNTTTEGNLPNGNKITYESLISIYSLREYNSNNKELINEYKFNTWIFKDISTPQTPSLYHYSTIVNNITTINVTVQWYNQTTNITFANQILTMQPSSLKYRIEIDSYPFQSSFNYLQLVMSASIVSSDNNGACSISQTGTIDKDEYIQLQVNDHSLYGRFIKRGIVDGKVTSISNTFINSENSGKSSSNLIGMNIPIYKESVSLDPDFSVLIDTKSASDVQGSVCQSLPKKKLSPSQLAGIIIGCVAFVAIVGISTAYYFYKKKQQKHFAKKLSKLNK